MSVSCIPIFSDLPVSQEWIRQNENGVIEMKGQNPIDQAIKINREQCVLINTQLINDRATRKAYRSIFKSFRWKKLNSIRFLTTILSEFHFTFLSLRPLKIDCAKKKVSQKFNANIRSNSSG